jgi:hypothetical protein
MTKEYNPRLAKQPVIPKEKKIKEFSQRWKERRTRERERERERRRYSGFRPSLSSGSRLSVVKYWARHTNLCHLASCKLS